MKYNKPPTTMKSMCKVKSSLVGIRKTLLLLSHKDNKQLINSNSKCKANVDYNSEGISTSELTRQIILYPKEFLNVKGKFADENKTFLQGRLEEYVPNKYFPLSLAAINSSIKQDSVDRIYSPDVRTELMYNFKPNMWSKKISQGKTDLVQREVNKYVAMTDQASSEEHKLCNAVNLNLLQVTTNGDIRHDNMPITRSQMLNSQKRNASSYIQTALEGDVNAEGSTLTALKNLVHSSPPVSASETLRKPSKDFESVDFQQTIFRAGSSSPDPAVIRTVIKAVIEPLPEDKNKNNKLTQKPQKNRKFNKKASNKLTPIDFDAIEIINSPDKKARVRPKTKEINLPRTLTELNRNIHFNEVLTENQESSTGRKQTHFSPTSVKQVHDSVGKSGRQGCGEENYNLSNNNAKIPPSKKVVQRKGRVRSRSTQPKSKPKTKRQNIYRKNSGDSSDASFTAQGKDVTLCNVTKCITRRKNKYDDFNTLINSIKDNVLTSPSKESVDTTLIKKRPVLNRFCKRNANQSCSKNYYPDIVVRKDAYDGCESSYSDDELFSAIKRNKRKINTSTTKSKLKYVRRSISLKPISGLQKKTPSSSSSSVPDLEIEWKTPPRPVAMERLTSTDSLLEDAHPEPVKVLPTIKVLSNNSPTIPLVYDEKENTYEEYVPAVVGDKFAIKVAENVPNHVIDQDTHCGHDFIEMYIESNSTITEPTEVAVEDQNALRTDDDAWTCMLSPLTTETFVDHSNEAIISWIETGLPTDATEVFKSTAEAVLSGYANMIKAYLLSLKGPVHPSLINLYEMLIKHDHNINSYLKKK